MTVLTVLQRLAQATSCADKEQVLFEAFIAGEADFFFGARLALDPLVMFGVSKVAEIVEDDGALGDYSFGEFVALAHGLWRGRLTGAEARQAINDAAARCHAATWNLFYRRILLKADIGVQAPAFNRVLDKLAAVYQKAKDYRVPVFGCQLPHDGDARAYRHKLRGRKRIEVSPGGFRVLCIIDVEAHAVSLFTPKGRRLRNFPELETSFKELMEQLPGSMVLDGELVARTPVERMVRCKNPHPDSASVKFALFDILPLADFRTGFCAIPQCERHTMLVTMQECGLWQATNGRIFVVPQIEVDLSSPEGQAALVDFGQLARTDGRHTLMVKDPDAPYEMKRTSAWLQVRVPS